MTGVCERHRRRTRCSCSDAAFARRTHERRVAQIEVAAERRSARLGPDAASRSCRSPRRPVTAPSSRTLEIVRDGGATSSTSSTPLRPALAHAPPAAAQFVLRSRRLQNASHGGSDQPNGLPSTSRRATVATACIAAARGSTRTASSSGRGLQGTSMHAVLGREDPGAEASRSRCRCRASSARAWWAGPPRRTGSPPRSARSVIAALISTT